MSKGREEKEMAVESIAEKMYLDKRATRIIANSKPVKIMKTDIAYDINEFKQKRSKEALEMVRSKKWK